VASAWLPRAPEQAQSGPVLGAESPRERPPEVREAAPAREPVRAPRRERAPVLRVLPRPAAEPPVERVQAREPEQTLDLRRNSKRARVKRADEARNALLGPPGNWKAHRLSQFSMSQSGCVPYNRNPLDLSPIQGSREVSETWPQPPSRFGNSRPGVAKIPGHTSPQLRSPETVANGPAAPRALK
jgi:hypothetical protein